MATDHRQNAKTKTDALVSLLRGGAHEAELRGVIDECEALSRAIGAFHMEGIRFRMYNVDRLLSKGELPLPPDAVTVFTDVRRELEAAGFHTRSHQAPPTA